MPEPTLDDALAEVLRSFRNALAVSRARCYAMTPTGSYRLAASFGFVSRFGPEDALMPGHPLIEWVQHNRRPSFVNSPIDAGRLGELMERDHYAHSLTAPIYEGSRLVGILELQDRLGGAPFSWEDIRRVELLVQRVESVIRRFGDRSVAEPEPLAEEDREALFLDGRSAGKAEFPAPPDLFSRDRGARAPSTVADAPTASPGGEAARNEETPELTRRETAVLRGFLHALLLSPEIDAVVFSLWTRGKADALAGARREIGDRGRETLWRQLEAALASAVPDLRLPGERSLRTEFPVGRSEGEISDPGGMQTSVIFSGARTLLLTLVFARPPGPAIEAALKETHRLVRAAVLQVRGAERYRASYRSLIHFLIEPDRRSFPQLKAHSLAVGALCRRFAAALSLPAETVEQFTVAGLLHDVGLKDLDIPYERIAGRRALDMQELGLVRQHPAVGASLISRIEFPYPVAPLVRHHHERFDGAGYPDRLAGEHIPLGSRVIAIAEAYDAMVAPHSYRSPVSSEAALEIIMLKGGTQFDPDLTKRFPDLVRESVPEDDVQFPKTEP